MVVLCHLRGLPSVAQVAVWGASMGAAASIFYQARGGAATPPWPTVDAAVLDSPYPDFTQLAHHLVSKRQFGGFTLPSMLVHATLQMLESSVEKNAGFSIQATNSRPTHRRDDVNELTHRDDDASFD